MLARLRSMDPYIWVVGASTVVVNVLVHLVNHRFDYGVFVSNRYAVNLEQLLDPVLLKDHLVSSLWALNMQPPLYNLGVGLLLHFPPSTQRPLAEVALVCCYAVTGVATYASMTLLGVGRSLALAATLILVVADPAQFLFSMTIFYAAPAAALMTTLGYLGIRLAKRPTTANAALFSSCGVVLALFDTLLQPAIFVVLLALIVWLLRGARRAVIKGVAVPVLVLALYLVHMMVSFGSPTTSTWLGMNFAHATTAAAPPALVHRLVEEHRLTPMAEVTPFASLRRYGVAPNRVGPQALTEVTKGNGSPNLNNRAYIGVSDQSLSNDLRFVVAAPGQYARQVARGLSVWFVPADQYVLAPLRNRSVVGRYRDLYDLVVQWQPQPDSTAALQAAAQRQGVSWTRLSYLQLLETGLILVGLPVLILRNWARRADSIALLIPGLLFLQSFVVMNLTDVGENNRFRFEVGTLQTTLSLVVALALLRWGARWRAGRRIGVAPVAG